MLVSLSACSGGDGTDLDARAPASSRAESDPADADAPRIAPSDADVDADVDADSDADGSPDTTPAGPAASATVPGTEFALTVPLTVVDVPETGVPGLDSDDAFCASWSRFGGSFQVIAVNAAFGDGSPESTAALEVMASSTVERAYAALADAWPNELADERSVALDDALGPFARRLREARVALDAAGATENQVSTIERAWLDALATRAPDRAEVAVELPDELWVLVEDAAARHVGRVGGWSEDTSLVTRVDMPRTDGYLATQCPDQGTLAGGDADG